MESLLKNAQREQFFIAERLISNIKHSNYIWLMKVRTTVCYLFKSNFYKINPSRARQSQVTWKNQPGKSHLEIGTRLKNWQYLVFKKRTNPHFLNFIGLSCRENDFKHIFDPFARPSPLNLWNFKELRKILTTEKKLSFFASSRVYPVFKLTLRFFQ